MSDRAGLAVGDQILSVNGNDFRHIKHRDAVNFLTNLQQIDFHLRKMNKLPERKKNFNEIYSKFRQQIKQNENENNNKRQCNDDCSTFLLSNNFFEKFIDENDQIKLKNFLHQYLNEKIHIDQLIEVLLQILNKQNQQFRVKFQKDLFS